MKNLMWLVIAVTAISCSGGNSGFKKAKNGTIYKIFAGNSKDSIVKLGSGVAYSMIEHFGDSIGTNSYEKGHQLARVDSTQQLFDYKYVLSKMKVGDSAVVKISVDSIYKRSLDMSKQNDPGFNEKEWKKNVPKFFLQKGKFIEVGMKLLHKFELDPTKPEFKADSLKLTKFIEAQQATATAFQSKKNEKNMAAGKKFLDANKSKAGVITTPSGLQYQVITQGTGAKPTVADEIRCGYIGTTLDGKEFDNSYKRKEPTTFTIGQVIKGWQEILQIMPVGSKYKVWIPGDLAYGEAGNQGIEPGTLLQFEMEVLEIMPKQKAGANQAPQMPAAAQQHGPNDGHNHK